MSQPLINPNQKPPKEKTANSRAWYQKKRFLIPIGFLLFVSLVTAINGDEDSSDSQQSSTPNETVTQTQEAEANQEATEEEVPVVSLTIPDLVGQNTEDAIDELRELGFTEATSQDASYEERLVLLRSNWYVCEIRPAPGTTLDSDKTVVLLAVKNTEACPTESAGGSDAESAGGSDGSTEGDAGSQVTSAFGNLTDAQIAMNQIVADFVSQYDAAENDLQRGEVRLQRDEAICAAIGGSEVSNWSGVVDDLGATSEGYAYLYVATGKNVTLKTWNNEFSDLFDNTLVERGTALYDTLLGLKEGQIITFSGEFIRGDGACLDTSNLTEFYAVNRPEFVFKFTAINP